MASQRFISLDLFRGLTVALMFLVNLPGSFAHVYAPLRHADWHGLTFADLVFPWFLVCVGAAIPLALDVRRAKGLSRTDLTKQILWRSLLLFVIGVFLGWILRPRFTLEEIRIAGVLQRIAIVYCIAALVYLYLGARPVLLALLTSLILLLTWLLLMKMSVPGYGPANLEQGTNYFAWLDQEYLPGRLFRKTWDPEGIGGTLPALASALSGMAMLCWMRTRKIARQMLLLRVTGGVLIALGVVWSLSFPMNKNLWTSSYVLVTSGLGFLLWSVLDRVAGNEKPASWINLLLILGQTALTAYIVHWMLLRLLITKIADQSIGSHIFDALSPLFNDPRLASLLLACLYVSLSVLPMPWLKRKGWLIKV